MDRQFLSKTLLFINRRNFSELLACIFIIAILAISALGFFSTSVVRTKSLDVFNIADAFKKDVLSYYSSNGKMPSTDDIHTINDYIENEFGWYNFSAIQIDNGAITFTITDNDLKLEGSKITFRPAYQKQYPNGTIIWLCGYQSVPDNMYVDTQNHTNIDNAFLTPNCRKKV